MVAVSQMSLNFILILYQMRISNPFEAPLFFSIGNSKIIAEIKLWFEKIEVIPVTEKNRNT